MDSCWGKDLPAAKCTPCLVRAVTGKWVLARILSNSRNLRPSSRNLGLLAYDFERARNLSTPALIPQLRESGTQRRARDLN